MATATKKKLSAKNVAEYFLHLSNPEIGDSLSNLKLQKLCYYSQGFHLAFNGKPLFTEKIEAWQHGPVIRSLYHEYSKYGSGAVDCPEKINLSIYTVKVKELLNEVNKVFGQFSAWKLRNLTHEEAPWKEFYNKIDNVISHKSMETYFKTLLVD